MKVETKNTVTKPVYQPVVITLETAQEFIELFSILNYTKDSNIENSMRGSGFGELIGSYSDLANQLFDKMYSMKDKVKETI
jgi:hypothetical protein